MSRSCWLCALPSTGRSSRCLDHQTQCAVPNCTRPRRGNYCQMHEYRQRAFGNAETSQVRKMSPKTNRVISGQGYVQLRVNKKYKFEHRVIMEQTLGRPLETYENVHHINGDKQDNRPDNLELWITKQPKGQRVEDQLAWAYEILALYGEKHE